MRLNLIHGCTSKALMMLCFVGVFSADAANPAPYIDTLSPTAFAPGTAGAVLTIKGAGFASGAKVLLNGEALSPSGISSSTITVALPPTSIALSQTARVNVENVNPKSVSNTAYLPIAGPSSAVSLRENVGGLRLAYRPVVGDFNNDGIPDYVALYRVQDLEDPRSRLYLGDGHGGFTEGPKLPSEADQPLAVADLDNDGNLDLICLKYNGYQDTDTVVLMGDGKGGLTFKQRLKTSREFAVAADVTGDGILDLVAGGVFPGLGDGSFATTPVFSRTVYAVGDFDGDGIPDLIADSSDAGGLTQGIPLSLYKNDGRGHFTFTGKVIDTGLVQFAALTGDFNGDGRLDLFYETTGGPHVALNEGSGNFTVTGQTFGTNEGHNVNADFSIGLDLVVADFNGDGIPDVACASGIYLNDGAANFTLASKFPLPQDQIGGLAASDFNGDGKMDLLCSLNPYTNPPHREWPVHVFLQVPGTHVSMASYVDFGTHGVGIWVNNQFPITNTGSEPLQLSNVSISPDTQTGPTDFGYDLNTCASPVPPGATCRLHLTHRSSIVGTGRAVLSLSGNFLNTEVNLRGIGSLFTNLKNVHVGKTLRFEVPVFIANGYPPTLRPTLTPGPGTPAGDFHVSPATCSYLYPGQTCVMVLTFTPSRAGFEWVTLHVNNKDPNAPMSYTTLYLYGWGVAAK